MEHESLPDYKNAKRKPPHSRNGFHFLMSISSQKIFRIVVQAGKRMDVTGACLNLLSGVVGKRVEVTLCLWLTSEQSVQVGIMH